MTVSRLTAYYGSAAAAVHALAGGDRPKGLGALRLAAPAVVDAELDRLEKLGARLLVLGDPEFPPLLAQLEPPPPVLTVLGDIALAGSAGIALVGARNASANGRKLAALIATGLGRAGETVVSGFARGIDTAAHHAALDTGTIGVLAGGIDMPYPAENTGLYHLMVEKGAVVSEMPPGFQARAKEFPRRNRIISGLSRGVVVVEAAERSGSLITARFALEQNREVFAVPGSPLDARCRGTNQLLRDGAVLTESAADILDVLRAAAPRPPPPRAAAAQSAPGPLFARPATPQPVHAEGTLRDTLLGLLSPTPVAIDELMRQCGCGPAEFQSLLLDLELSGELIRHPGSAVSARGSRPPASS